MGKMAAKAGGKAEERRVRRGGARDLICVVCAVLAMTVAWGPGIAARAQSLPASSGGSAGIGGQGIGRPGMDHPAMEPMTGSDDSLDPVMQERRWRALNIERQKELVADTNKLLKLAKELNDEVAAASAESFSGSQLRKIAEIEKLAKSVKERMTVAIGAGTNLLQSPTVIYPLRQGP